MKNCHFCGYDNQVKIIEVTVENQKNPTRFIAECSCGARGSFGMSESEAKEIWNDISMRYDSKEVESIAIKLQEDAEGSGEIKHMNAARRCDWVAGAKSALTSLFAGKLGG